MRNKVPPPIITLICGFLIYLSKPFFPELIFNYYNTLSLFFLILGLIIIITSFRLFKKEKTTINPIMIEKASSLVTSGVFKYSRNPMYLGMVLILISISIKFNFYGGILIVALFFFFITHFQIIPEEKAMLKLFGKEFIKYKKQTRRWI